MFFILFLQICTSNPGVLCKVNLKNVRYWFLIYLIKVCLKKNNWMIVPPPLWRNSLRMNAFCKRILPEWKKNEVSLFWFKRTLTMSYVILLISYPLLTAFLPLTRYHTHSSNHWILHIDGISKKFKMSSFLTWICHLPHDWLDINIHCVVCCRHYRVIWWRRDEVSPSSCRQPWASTSVSDRVVLLAYLPFY